MDADASNLAFGVMTSGRTRAGFDGVRLAVREDDGSWRTIPIPQPGFEEEGGWGRAGSSRNAVVTYPTDAPPEGRRWLSLAPPDPAAAATPSSAPKALFEAPLEAGAYVDVDLGAGLRARVPLVLEDSEAAVSDAQKAALETLKAELARLPEVGDATDPDTRAADVIVAWSVFRHFYPYWPEVEVDWDAALPALFEDAARAQSREGQADALRRLVARVRDGHARVHDPRASQKMGGLPLNLRWLDKQLVVTASGAPEQVAVGDVVTTIDGRPAAACFADSEALRSGSPQWRAASAVYPLLAGPEGSRVSLDIERATGAVKVELAREKREPVRESRPDAVTELLSHLQPGVWYVDLTRAKWAEVQAKLEELAKARAVVFDVRGYPTDAGAKILAHLVPVPDQDLWMHVPQIAEPFARVASWHDVGWNIQPLSPRLSGKIAFLTDGRAISYAESVMGYVDDWKLGAIVGSPTAGTNGNVNTFTVPSGLRIAFTGMKVTRHDGSVFHLRGAVPTVPVEPTLAGIRAGKDEVLERALEAVSPTKP